MSVSLSDVRLECEKALLYLEPWFKEHIELTLLVRNPKSDDGDMVITNDNLDDVIDALERLKLKEAL